MIRLPNLIMLLCYLLCTGAIEACQSDGKNTTKEKLAGVKEPDPNSLDGSWVQVSLDQVPPWLAGKAKATSLRPRFRVWYFVNGQLTIEYKDRGWEVGRYQLINGKGYNEIDLNANSFDNPSTALNPGLKTGLLKGIYQVESDSLKLSLATRHNAPRPTRFLAKKGSNSLMFEFRRGAPLKNSSESAADLKKLQGTWRVTELREAGILRQKSKTWRWIIVGDQIKWMSGKSPRETPIFKLNANRNPKQIFMAHPNSNYQNLLVTGIYKLDDKNLELCLNLGAPGYKFEFKMPKEFSSTGSNTLVHVKLERETHGSPAVPFDISSEQLTAPQHHAKQIQGTWRIIDETRWGTKFPSTLELRPQVVVTADKIAFVYDKQQLVQQYRYSLDPSNEPGRIKLNELAFPQNKRINSRGGDSHLGIYLLSDKTLHLAFSRSNKKRPREFLPRKLSRTFVLERVVPAETSAGTGNLLQQRTADMTRSRKNLTRLGLATYEFFEVHKRLPSAAIVNKKGQSTLSWRVALLPYLGLADLHKQFKLDEPWNSPHNKALLSKMPDVYSPVGVKTKEPFQTFYQVFVGKGTPFESSQGLRLSSIKDGVSSTLLIVEAGEPVLWTKPVDLAFDPEKPLPKLGGLFQDRVHAVFLDASVRAIKQPFDESLFRLAITYDDLQPLDLKHLTQGK
ncbi:TIGR03067 domain-containing protein [Gimesia aquarii]|uniref:DUF1559 domain-containing protein n=1 Tax=Gimesia aquarii TaxID=2527964 RepID=A0A517WQ09_9PLAN|nr:TIGR03067 domain-containing protein [Gimesia aquarii]QDU07333.1 hypothetical protein V202x_06850 [Gimesia aquarii]